MNAYGKPPEVRIVAQTRQPDGRWETAATIPLDDEQRKIVAGWVSRAGYCLWPEPTIYDDFANAIEGGGGAEPEYVTNNDLWALSDDELRRTFEGEDGLLAMTALANQLDDFDGAITQRLGQPLLFDLYARKLDDLGYDGAAFRNLPLAEQTEYLSRFVDGAMAPLEH